jgi:hypothetical protein
MKESYKKGDSDSILALSLAGRHREMSPEPYTGVSVGRAIELTAMQRRTIQARGRHWVLRFWEYEIRDGVRVRVNVHKKLAPIGPAYPDKRSVEPLAWKQLEPIHTRLQTPESATPIIEFVETVYLPMVKQFRRPSTYKDYKRDAWEKHFKHRLANLRLCDFRTAHGSV